MYGSIRKSYGAKKASSVNEKENRKMLFKRNSKKKSIDRDDLQQTSYINVERVRCSKNSKAIANKVEEPKTNEKEQFTEKNEFPIASVILTIVFTMMVMVLAFGFGGVI